MLDRQTPPIISPLQSLTLPKADVITLDNGMRLHCLYNQQQPIIKLELVFKAGKWYEHQKGVSYFTAKMLLEGTKNYTAKQIAETISFYGASLECNQGFDRSTLTLYCLSKHFLNLLPLVLEILTQSIFPEKELSILKTRTQQNISVEKEKSSYLATQALTKSIYGSSHPYVAGMDEESIRYINKDQLREFFNNFFKTTNIDIFLSGGISEALLQPFINILKEINFPNNAFEFEPLNSSELNQGDKKVYLKRTDQLQSSIRIGCTWPQMNAVEYPKLSLLNKILGGYFGSRLMKNIREDKGFTYGIFSTISSKEKDSLFYIGTDVKAENTEETIKEIYKEINILRSELISIDELETVKNYIIGKFLNDTSTIFEQSDKYKSIVLHQLPLNFYDHYTYSIQSATPSDILHLAKIYLEPEKLTEVVVGNHLN